jgi:hypothetical protein
MLKLDFHQNDLLNKHNFARQFTAGWRNGELTHIMQQFEELTHIR